MSIISEIKKRISTMNEGDVFTTSDFSDISSITTARKCLGRCVEEGIIRRVFDGVYEKPRYSEVLKEYVPTNPEHVANALAKSFHWTIAPCEDIALNKLGLTTQVPAVWSYISDGPYRCYKWDNVVLVFKHRTNREISLLSEKTILIIEALRSLGKDRINDAIIRRLSKQFTSTEKNNIMTEASDCSEWILETIRKVCCGYPDTLIE